MKNPKISDSNKISGKISSKVILLIPLIDRLVIKKYRRKMFYMSQH